MKRAWAILGVAILGVTAGAARAEMAPPPYPLEDLKEGHQGRVMLEVTFAGSGAVTKCVILKTTAPDKLSEYTRAFVADHWDSAEEAGKTVDVPIVYQLPPSRPKVFSVPSPSYPEEAFFDNEGGVVEVSVTFGSDGRVARCVVMRRDAPQLLQDWTVTFIKAYWVAPSWRGMTIDVPVVYDPSGRKH